MTDAVVVVLIDLLSDDVCCVEGLVSPISSDESVEMFNAPSNTPYDDYDYDDLMMNASQEEDP